MIPLKSLGADLFLFGACSILLRLLRMHFLVLDWIDLWGPKPGWLIRIGLVTAGALLWQLGRSREAADP